MFPPQSFFFYAHNQIVRQFISILNNTIRITLLHLAMALHDKSSYSDLAS